MNSQFWESQPVLARILFLLAYLGIMGALLLFGFISLIVLVVISVVVMGVFVIRWLLRGGEPW